MLPAMLRRPPIRAFDRRRRTLATVGAIELLTGSRRAGFDTAGFDASELVTVGVELAVAAGTTCGIATTPFRAISAGLPLIRWTVA